MDKTIIGLIIVIAGSFSLGFLVSWHFWSNRFNRLTKALKMWNGLVLLYKDQMAAANMPAGASKYIKQANEIYAEMKKLLSELDRPNMNASHSLYKNELRSRVIEMNIQRLDMLQKAVENGYDPKIEFNGEMTPLSVVIMHQRRETQSLASDTKFKKKGDKGPAAPAKKDRHLSVVKP